MTKYAPVTKVAPGMSLVLVVPNPKRPGKAAFARYAKYPKALPATLTVAAGAKWADSYAPFGRGGPTVADLRYDLAHGFIKLEGTGKPTAPTAPAPKAAGKPKGGKKAAGKPTAPTAPSAAPAAPASGPTAE